MFENKKYVTFYNIYNVSFHTVLRFRSIFTSDVNNVGFSSGYKIKLRKVYII